MSYTNLLCHIVIRTHACKPAIPIGPDESLYQYIGGFCKGKKCSLYEINGMPDHIHLLVEMHPSIALSDFIRELKVAAGGFIHEHRSDFPMFERWGKEYFAIAVGQDHKEQVKNYIKNQKTHHKKMTMEEELSNICQKLGIADRMQLLLRD